PEPLRVGWRENEGPVPPRMHLGNRAVGMYGGLHRPVLGHGNGLPSLQVRVRGRDGAGEKKCHGPVRGLEDLGELLLDRDGHPELDPAERCCQGEGREWPGGLPFASSASEGREAVTTPPSTHSSAPSATITPSCRLTAITPPAGPPRWACGP